MNSPQSKFDTLDDDEPFVILDDLSDVSPQSLFDLVSFAQRCLSDGEGLSSLQSLGLADADLASAYQIGYLPASVLDAVPQEVAALVKSRRLQNVFVLPAYDDTNQLTDALIIEPAGQVRGLSESHIGLLGSVLSTAPSELHLVDTYQELSVQWRSGSRSVQLVRSPADVTANLSRFVDASIKRVVLNLGFDEATIEQIRQAFTAAGIVVSLSGDSASCQSLQLIEFDKDTRQAVFSSGDLAITCSIPIQLPAPSELQFRQDKKKHRDRFDISIPAQRKRFVHAASRTFQMDVIGVESLLEQLAEEIHELVEPTSQNKRRVVQDVATDSVQVDALLSDKNIFDRFNHDFTNAGWIGDEQIKQLALLTLAGRCSQNPPWLMIEGTSSETLPMLTRLADLLPNESRLQPTNPSKGWFASQGRDGFSERVIILDDADRLSREFVCDLKRFHAHDTLAVPVVSRNITTGKMESVVRQMVGPLSLIAAAEKTTSIDDMVLNVPLKRSEQQTIDCIEAERARRRNGSVTAPHNMSLWRHALATIPRIPVATPWIDRLVFPATHPSHVRDYNLFITLAEASALLHYKQRAQIDGSLISTDADVQNAIAASAGLLAAPKRGISHDAELVLTTLQNSSSIDSVTLPWLEHQLPRCSPNRIRHAVDELERFEFVTRTSSGRGRRPAIISLNADMEPTKQLVTIQLLPQGQFAPTAAEQIKVIRGIRENGFANISPVAASG